MSEAFKGFSSNFSAQSQIYQASVLRKFRTVNFLGPGFTDVLEIADHLIEKEKNIENDYFIAFIDEFPDSLFELFEADGEVIYNSNIKQISVPYDYETERYHNIADEKIPLKTGILKIDIGFILSFYIKGTYELSLFNIIIANDSVGTNQILNEGIKRVLAKQAAQTRSKLKPGIYKAMKNWTETGYQLKLKERKEFPKIPIVHETFKSVKEDVEIFFGDTLLKLYDRYNIPPMRKILLTGPAGTGKSSMAMAISDAWKTKLSIFYVSDMETLKLLADALYRFNVPGIIIIEDFDQFYDEQNNTTELLNFLDGADVPTTKNGLYFIFTSNVPKDLDPRLIDRPGRIDRIVEVGKLEGQEALECLINYLPEAMDPSEEFKNKMLEYFNVQSVSGAEIKAIVVDAIKTNLSLGKEELTAKDVIKAEKNLRKSIKRAKKMDFLYDEDENDDGVVKTPKPKLKKKKSTNAKVDAFLTPYE